MIPLEDDRLAFTFPKIARQLRAHVERQIPSCPSSSFGTRLSAKPRFVRQPAETVGDPAAALDEAGASRTGCVSKLELGHEEEEIEAALRAAGLHDASFPALAIAFQRTLRIPDDGRTYPFPAGLGAFPLRSVDDFPATAPASWLQRGGVVLPMDQSEAIWISFPARVPCTVKIAAGKINAVSGAAWTAERHSEPQDDVVVPGRPWLDGFSVGAGLIRQFVALPEEDLH